MSNIVNTLRQSDIFYGMNATQLELIGNLCVEHTFDAGEIIFPEGAANDELYVIVQGEVEIQVNPALVSARTDRPLPSSTIAVLRRGQCFGEIALVDQGVRSATARAAQKNTRVLVLESKHLLGLCETYPELGYRLMANLAADIALKMRNTDLLIREELLYGAKRG